MEDRSGRIELNIVDPEQEADDPAVRDGHSLGSSGGTGGVHDVGAAVERGRAGGVVHCAIVEVVGVVVERQDVQAD